MWLPCEVYPERGDKEKAARSISTEGAVSFLPWKRGGHQLCFGPGITQTVSASRWTRPSPGRSHGGPGRFTYLPEEKGSAFSSSAALTCLSKDLLPPLCMSHQKPEARWKGPRASRPSSPTSLSSHRPLSSLWQSLPKRPLAPRKFKRGEVLLSACTHSTFLPFIQGAFISPLPLPHNPLQGEFSYEYCMKWGPQARPLQAANWKPCQKWEEEAEGEKQQPSTEPLILCTATRPSRRVGLSPSQAYKSLSQEWDLRMEALGDSGWQIRKGHRDAANGPPDPRPTLRPTCSMSPGCPRLWTQAAWVKARPFHSQLQDPRRVTRLLWALVSCSVKWE